MHSEGLYLKKRIVRNCLCIDIIAIHVSVYIIYITSWNRRKSY